MRMDMHLRDFGKGMGIPPVPAHMEIFRAAPVSIGVEFRILNDDVLAANGIDSDQEQAEEDTDTGVSLHVFVDAEDGDLERLRFDCFADNPHYHYMHWADGANRIAFFDSEANGDMLAWALDRIQYRLPQMLQHAGIKDAGDKVDRLLIEQLVPEIAEAAYRARFQSDQGRVTAAALADGAQARAAMPS